MRRGPLEMALIEMLRKHSSSPKIMKAMIELGDMVQGERPLPPSAFERVEEVYREIQREKRR